MHPVQKIHFPTLSGKIFNPTSSISKINNYNLNLIKLKNGFTPFSGDYIQFYNSNPNWHKNYFNNQESNYKNIDWWKIPDFDPKIGDIKTIWELSRFEWVVQLALMSNSNNQEAINLLNDRLSNWINDNQLYKGVNWKCGQEASIRLIHLILAAIFLNQLNSPTKSFIDLIEAHIKRIAPTISYAICQNNNHGTSEAAALFIGGNFLSKNGLNKYNKIEQIGRKLLEDRSKKLFSVDGCFCQYSINYHRLALDTYIFCETYRKSNNLKPFSNHLYVKLKKATLWLESLTDLKTGDAPNIGANDGARLFNIFNSDYRDFRPTVQWANLIFNNRLIYEVNEHQKSIYNILGINIEFAKIEKPVQDIQIMGNEDGFFIYKRKALLFVFRRPIFKFRPSHSDALHIDLWLNSINILRDGGTFSYNTSYEKMNYYTGSCSHNTVEIDSRNQMKKISRFLFGSWLIEQNFIFQNNENNLIIKSGYKDYNGASHIRTITIKNNFIQVVDFVKDFKNSARLIFRLAQNQWISKKVLNGNKLEIDLSNKTIIGNFSIRNEYESKYYLKEEKIPVISQNINNGIDFTTNIYF